MFGPAPLQVVAVADVVTEGTTWLLEVNVPKEVTSLIIPTITPLPALTVLLTILSGPDMIFIPLTCTPLIVKASALLVPITEKVIVIVDVVTDIEADWIFIDGVKDTAPLPARNSKLAGAVSINVVLV
jgi:hypothetical protein